MKKKIIVSYKFVDVSVDGVETVDEFGNDVVRFYVYKENKKKEYLFGLTKEITKEAMENDTLKEMLQNYISENHN
ncbi:MAG: hypothetical protein E7556_01435 [Ruminococcaceae bacterium]|nr:hypothetical protein [Oscillospiraceae bacterium]